MSLPALNPDELVVAEEPCELVESMEPTRPTEVVDIPLVASSNFKLPTFWPNDTELWFAQVEMVFMKHHIRSQSQKFIHVVSSLSPEHASEVRDIILDPPIENQYYYRLILINFI